jgi:outer membrane protein
VRPADSAHGPRGERLRPALAAAALCTLAAWPRALPAQVLTKAPPTLAAQAPRAQPLTLAQAHAIALANHPDIAAANYRAQAEHQVFVQSRSGLLPQVSLYGSQVHAGAENTRLMAGGLNNPTVFSRSAIGTGVSQLITDFGRTTNLVASSRLQASAADQSARATREQVLLEVDRSYFGALQAQGVRSVARQTLDTRELLLERVTILAANKLKSELDVSFAQVGLEDARLLLERAQNEVDSTLAALSTVLGYREQRPFTLADEAAVPVPATADVAPLVEQALRDRPELASLRDQRDAAQHLARSLRDARLPTISAVLAAGDAPSHDVRLPDSYSAGGIEVTLPLFAGGFYQARQREAELRARAAAEGLRTVEDNISRDVRIAWLSLNNARERLRTTAQLRRYAATAYDLADARYRAGSSSIVEVSQAQLALTAAQIDETTARYEVLIREADLNYQIGAPAGIGAAPPDASSDSPP